MRNRGKYVAIGYVVSKFVVPVAKRQAKRTAKRKARRAVTSTASVARAHPASASIAVGASVGALGWLLTRGHRGEDTFEQ